MPAAASHLREARSAGRLSEQEMIRLVTSSQTPTILSLTNSRVWHKAHEVHKAYKGNRRFFVIIVSFVPFVTQPSAV
jgi:hypothetical protein